MKRLIVILIVSTIVFVCFIKIIFSLFDSVVFSITGSIEYANLDSDGNIVIIDEEITEQPTYLSYVYDNVTIGLLAIRNSKGKVAVVVNTCRFWTKPSNSYFVLKGKKLKSTTCNIKIPIDKIDVPNDDSCYPILIEDRKDVDGKIIIGTEQLKGLTSRFEHWNGPKED